MVERGYKYFRWLSLDIVLGAIVFLAFLCQHYQITISIHVYFALASAVWLIYTADHLLDSRKPAISERRRFHKRHFRIIGVICGVTFSLALFNVYFLPVQVIKAGAVLSALCILYLTLVYFLRGLWFKELLVAFGYAAGVFLGPFSLSPKWELVDWLLVVELAIVALINLLIFSIYDLEEDQKEGFGSIPNRMGMEASKRLINLLLLSSVTLSLLIAGISSETSAILVVYLIMSLILGSVLWLPRYYGINERFRLVGDAVFFLPLLFLL
ncbi:MAG: UbiA family prenyltransferase [Cyclobacteriaceae bacterium]